MTPARGHEGAGVVGARGRYRRHWTPRVAARRHQVGTAYVVACVPVYGPAINNFGRAKELAGANNRLDCNDGLWAAAATRL